MMKRNRSPPFWSPAHNCVPKNYRRGERREKFAVSARLTDGGGGGTPYFGGGGGTPYFVNLHFNVWYMEVAYNK